jgi:hypothetical protein
MLRFKHLWTNWHLSVGYSRHSNDMTVLWYLSLQSDLKSVSKKRFSSERTCSKELAIKDSARYIQTTCWRRRLIESVSRVRTSPGGDARREANNRRSSPLSISQIRTYQQLRRRRPVSCRRLDRHRLADLTADSTWVGGRSAIQTLPLPCRLMTAHCLNN